MFDFRGRLAQFSTWTKSPASSNSTRSTLCTWRTRRENQRLDKWVNEHRGKVKLKLRRRCWRTTTSCPSPACCSLKSVTGHVKYWEGGVLPSSVRSGDSDAYAVVTGDDTSDRLARRPWKSIFCMGNQPLSARWVAPGSGRRSGSLSRTIRTLLGNHNARLQLPLETVLHPPLVQLSTTRRCCAWQQDSLPWFQWCCPWGLVQLRWCCY